VKFVAVVLTHNAQTHNRLEMLSEAATSLSEADEVLIVDNGSSDGSDGLVERLGGSCYRPADGVSTCGRGMNICITAAAKRGDIVVFSNDDIIWRPGWRDKLERFWNDCPPEVAIVAGLLEEDYFWNQPRGVIEVDGVRGLWRETVPGGAWTLRAAEWPQIGPVPEKKGWDDVPTCRRLNANGRKCVALDLADHAGVDSSTWGNGSKKFEKPLDRVRWGL
jgi:hypothetical protein